MPVKQTSYIDKSYTFKHFINIFCFLISECNSKHLKWSFSIMLEFLHSTPEGSLGRFVLRAFSKIKKLIKRNG